VALEGEFVDITKNKKNSAWKQVANRALFAATRFQASFFLGLYFDTEDGDDMFLRNIRWLSTDYIVLYSRR
jgi:hypothetical protein